jgi:acyl dehydratase
VSTRHTRPLEITEESIRAYSRRGNYHSDRETAAAIGLPGLVAQGVHAAGPAYGVLLDAWGDDLLARGEIEMTFVGTVLAGDTVRADVEIGDGVASFEVVNVSRGRPAVVGRARLREA